MMKTIKDKLFYYAVEKNPHILHEYQQYRWNNVELHKKHRLKSWLYLGNLNFKHRFLKIQSINIGQTEVKKVNQRKPYLYGSESQLSAREPVQHFAKKLLKHDVISFDIFDTLILRPLAVPADMFYMLELEHSYLNFANIRRESEQEARKIKYEASGTYEITIYDIYQIVCEKTGLDIEYCINLELEMEIFLCFGNPYMKQVFEILRNNNKRIIAVSDMYWPKDKLKFILDKCGFSELENIYVSCDYDASKRHMGLYQIVDRDLRKVGNETIIHVGDNYISDIEKGKEFGWDTVYYRNVNVVGKEYRTINMSRLTLSAYRGIVNAHLHNGSNNFTPYYEYGFTYGGVLMVGFCSWIHKYCLEHNIDKILFVSRDGDIIQKTYNLLFNGQTIDNEYIYWSRNPGKILNSEISRFDYFRQYIDYKCGNNQTFTMYDILDSMDLLFLLPELSTVDLNESDPISVNNKDKLKEVILAHWTKVQEHYEKNRIAAKMYFDPIIESSNKVAIVDIGWQGTGLIDLKKTINNVLGYSCDIKCLMMGYFNKDIDYTTPFFMKDEINVFLWSSQHNKELYYKHRRRPQNNILMELFTTAQHPSFKNLRLNDSEKDYEFVFDAPEIENYEMINEVQKGIYDFAKLYYKSFKNMNYMFNISGYDAYEPFNYITEDLTFMKNFFSDYSFNRFIGGVKGNEFYSLDDIFKEFNL